MKTTRRDWFLHDAVVPFSFTRARCFLCDERAVAWIAGEPVCRTHEQRVRAIQRDAEREAARTRSRRLAS